MKGDWEDRIPTDLYRRYRRNESTPEKGSNLWSEFYEKEKEVTIYKERLKELEIAFNYNLELISERDLELSFLEKQLRDENERFRQVLLEKNELDDLVKNFDERSHRKIQQLETKLNLKDDEIRELQRESINNVASLKRMLEDTKKQHQKQIYQLTTKYEMRKNDFLKEYREELDEKEKYYLLEIDNLTGQIQEMRKENERLLKLKEENISLKSSLTEIKKLYQEKEKYYLEELKMKNSQIPIDKEVQCGTKTQVSDEKIQVEPTVSRAESQTIQNEDLDEYYEKKISFLQEQNEVLKWIVKDLKKNRDVEGKTEDEDPRGECMECRTVKAEVEEVNKKFESEIDNLKKIFYDEQKQRAEEETVIQSLESSVTCLKDKLLVGLQEKLEDFAGDDICSYTYNREIQNEIKVSLLEQKVDSLISTVEEDRRKFEDRLQQVKNECLEKIDKFRNEQREPKSENLLEKIRMEIQKLENKIESDMKNVVRNNIETNKCDKNLQTRMDFSEKREMFDPKFAFSVFPQVVPKPDCFYEMEKPRETPKMYYKNDITAEKCISVLKLDGEPVKFRNHLRRKRAGDAKTFGKMVNDVIVGR